MCESNLITTPIYAKFEAYDPNYPTKLIINVIYISHLLTKDDKLLIRFDSSYCKYANTVLFFGKIQ